MKNILTLFIFFYSFCAAAQTILKFENDIELHIMISPFETQHHQIDTCYFEDQAYICRIDNSNWFGGDHGTELPKYELVEIILYQNNKEISLDVSQMFNPTFSRRISKRHFEVKVNQNQIEIHGWFSDGAGFYCAQWVVEDGISIRTLISNREVDCFE